jgi:hypothetical protein
MYELKLCIMRAAAFSFFLTIIFSLSSHVFGLEHDPDKTYLETKGFLEVPLLLIPAGHYSLQFPDQSLTPELDPIHSIGGSYSYYKTEYAHFSPELKFQSATLFNDSWDRRYRPNIGRSDEAEVSLSQSLTTLSLGVKYVPRSWRRPLRPFASAHFGRTWMRNTIAVLNCDEEESDDEMLERFLKQNAYTYNFEIGLEYDFGEVVVFASATHLGSWDKFEYYDFDALNEYAPSSTPLSSLGRDEFRSELVDFHKTAPRHNGRLSMFGFQVGAFLRLAF